MTPAESARRAAAAMDKLRGGPAPTVETVRAAVAAFAIAERGQAIVADAAPTALRAAEARLTALEVAIAGRDAQERASMSSRLRFPQ
jgi:hypothetical protein